MNEGDREIISNTFDRLLDHGCMFISFLLISHGLNIEFKRGLFLSLGLWGIWLVFSSRRKI